MGAAVANNQTSEQRAESALRTRTKARSHAEWVEAIGWLTLAAGVFGAIGCVAGDLAGAALPALMSGAIAWALLRAIAFGLNMAVDAYDRNV